MVSKTLGLLLIAGGIILAAFGYLGTPPLSGASQASSSCPSTITIQFQDGLTVTGTLLSSSAAATAWNVGNANGLSATYSSSASYATIAADHSAVLSGPPFGYFQSASGGPTYLYTSNGYTYNSAGVCSNGVISSTSTSTTTSTCFLNGVIYQCSTSSTSTTTTTSTSTTGGGGIPTSISPVLLVGLAAIGGGAVIYAKGGKR